MKKLTSTLLLPIIFFTATACENSNSQNPNTNNANPQTNINPQTNLPNNTPNIPPNEMEDIIVGIKKNFTRINEVKDWSKIENLDLLESTEGGTLRRFYLNDRLEKIVCVHYGETFQKVVEYYLMDGQLSFTYEKKLVYNRPAYYDEQMMKENNDTEAFDIEKSKTLEKRTYFNKGNIVEQIIASEDFDTDERNEATRILDNFNKYKTYNEKK